MGKREVSDKKKNKAISYRVELAVESIFWQEKIDK